MSLFMRRQRPRQERMFGITGAGDLIPPRPGSDPFSAAASVTPDSSLRHSAVWACVRLRADLISTLPVDTFRRFSGIQVEMPKPPILVEPGGERVDILEWLYSSQVDLDRAGNAFGLITERNGLDLPQRIDLQSLSDCVVEMKNGQLRYRIANKIYEPDQVYHEKQFTIAGLPVGLSPVAYAAWSIGQYQSAIAFALDWYLSGGVPKLSLQNTERVIGPEVASEAKRRFKASIQGRDIFVHGKDWVIKPVSAEAVGQAWLESQQAGVLDIARFFGVPADLIDGSVPNNNITYANVTQRNLQLLILNLGPAIVRREKALSKLLPQKWYAKLNTDALLRLDPAAQIASFVQQVNGRIRTPDEVRELLNLKPLTSAQVDEFYTLFGPPKGAAPLPGAEPTSGPTEPATAAAEVPS